jgi:hypothetical protein
VKESLPSALYPGWTTSASYGDGLGSVKFSYHPQHLNLTKAFFEGNSNSITVDWVAFYRN